MEYKLEQIPREVNEDTETLTRLACATDSKHERLILVELQNEPSTNISEQVLAIYSDDSRMMLIFRYLKGNDFPDNQIDARRVKVEQHSISYRESSCIKGGA